MDLLKPVAKIFTKFSEAKKIYNPSKDENFRTRNLVLTDVMKSAGRELYLEASRIAGTQDEWKVTGIFTDGKPSVPHSSYPYSKEQAIHYMMTVDRELPKAYKLQTPELTLEQEMKDYKTPHHSLVAAQLKAEDPSIERFWEQPIQRKELQSKPNEFSNRNNNKFKK